VIAGNSHADRHLLHSAQSVSGERWWAFATTMDTTNPGTISKPSPSGSITSSRISSGRKVRAMCRPPRRRGRLGGR
jgi:hypothetical protein